MMSLDQQMKMRLTLMGESLDENQIKIILTLMGESVGGVLSHFLPIKCRFLQKWEFVNINTSIDVFHHSSVI